VRGVISLYVLHENFIIGMLDTALWIKILDNLL